MSLQPSATHATFVFMLASTRRNRAIRPDDSSECVLPVGGSCKLALMVALIRLLEGNHRGQPKVVCRPWMVALMVAVTLLL